LFSAALIIARDGKFSTARCREVIAAIGANLVQSELTPTAGAERTHGKACFQRYGSEGGGVRKEVEDGLPSAFEQGLPELKSAFADIGTAAAASKINGALIRTLLRLMTVTNDTNILYRKDLPTLRTIQHMAQHVLDAENGDAESELYAQLLSYCRRENVSPGGSADLLSVTLFLYFVDRSFSVPSRHTNTD
jgi:holo-ACP synthase / triphosphoribosyl-dephospho-CoA synthase